VYFRDAASYQEALQVWRTPEDVNAWIGARFSYDVSRAAVLSETQRSGSGRMPVYEPQEFIDAYAKYRGRPIVAFRELKSFRRQQRSSTLKQNHEERP
jgi:hypothetical protein